MAVCSMCGKKRTVGNNVSHAHNKTKRVFHPNLQRIKVMDNGSAKTLYVCTRCLRTGAIKKAV